MRRNKTLPSLMAVMALAFGLTACDASLTKSDSEAESEPAVVGLETKEPGKTTPTPEPKKELGPQGDEVLVVSDKTKIFIDGMF